ncbi:CHAT domain-containing protein [Streptomyces sp. NPDC054833]
MSPNSHEPPRGDTAKRAARDVPRSARDPEELVEELYSRAHDPGEEVLRLVLDITRICVDRLHAAQSSWDIDEALRILERTLERSPDRRLYRYVSLGYGIAFLEAFRVRRDTTDLSRALEGLRDAKSDVAPGFETGLTYYTLAHALLTAYEAGKAEESSVEEVIRLLDVALSQGFNRFTRRTDLVRLLAVAQSFRYRSRQGERRAAREFRDALSLLARYRAHEARASAPWRQLANTHGWMLLIGFDVEGREDDLAEAVRVLTEAADSGSVEPTPFLLLGDVVPDTRLNLAEALYHRALRSRRSADLDSVVRVLQTGLIDCLPTQRRNMLQLLADVSVVQYDVRGDRGALDRALSAGELALGMVPLTSTVYPEALEWAAQLRSALLVRTAERTHIDRSIALWRDAAMLAVRGRADASRPFRALADTLMMRLRIDAAMEGPKRENTAADLNTALASFDEAFRRAEGQHEAGRAALRHLLFCLVDYGAFSGDAHALEEARRFVETHLPGTAPTTLHHHETAQASSDTDLPVEGEAAQQHVAFYLGHGLNPDLFDSAPTDTPPLDEQHTQTYPYLSALRHQARRLDSTMTAYSLLRRERLPEAFAALEELCSSPESLGATLPWGTEARLVAAAPMDEVQQRLGDRQTIHLLATVEGGAALITDATSVRHVLLPALTTERVIELSRSIQTATGADRISLTGASLLEETCAELWKLCMRHVMPAVDPGRPVVLVPTGQLRLLPLHSAFRRDPETPAARRYLLDEWRLSYAPSASRVTAPASPDRSQAGVRVYGGGPETEVHGWPSIPLGDLWDDRFDRTSLPEVLGSETTALHFTGHGTANPLSPLDSWISLGDERVTVRGMLADGIRSPLVIVDSCHAGSSGGLAPPNPLPLSYSLVISGAKGCVAPLWQPGNRVARLLTAFFYEEWESHSPAEALRSAQLRLRNATNEQLVERLPELGSTPMSPGSRARWARVTPFAGIGHWAAFVYTGA